MDAKSELSEALFRLFPGEESSEKILLVLKGYTIIRETENSRSNLNRRISSFLGAKRIDGLSQKTLKNYRYTLDIFAQIVCKHVSKITTDDIREYISKISTERNLRDTSLQTHINVLRSFFSWLHGEGIIRRNPMLKIKSLKLDLAKARHALTAEELERMRDACRTYKEKALVEFFVSSGCRLSEAVGIRIDQINWRDRSVMVHGKGNKDRMVYFSVRTKLMLEEYLRNRKGGTALFASSRTPYDSMGPRAIQKLLQQIGERAHEERRVHPHLMRHTFATSALNAGMDIMVIQRLLGHNDIKTTQIYAELSQTTVQYQYERLVA